jgi:hypothetical protein
VRVGTGCAGGEAMPEERGRESAGAKVSLYSKGDLNVCCTETCIGDRRSSPSLSNNSTRNGMGDES